MIGKRRITWGVVIALTAALHLLALWFVFRYTTTYPLAIDDWIHFVPRADRLLEGNATWRDFFAARQPGSTAPPAIYLYSWSLVVPNVAWLNWDLQIDSLVNYALAAINSLILLIILGREQPQLLRYMVIPVTAVVLALQQRWNLLVSTHNALHLHTMAILLTLLVISSPRRGLLTAFLGIIVAFLGTFSSFVGWLTWIVLLMGLVLFGYRDCRIYLGYVVGAMLVIIALRYTPGFTMGSDSSYFVSAEQSSVLADLLGYILFTLVYLGALFNYGPDGNILISLLIGLLSLFVAGWNLLYLWRFQRYRRFVYVCGIFVVYGGMLGGMTAIGRLHQFGVRWGMAHHYMAHSAIYWSGLVGLVMLSLWHITQQARRERSLMILNLSLVLLGTVFYLYAVFGMLRLAATYDAEVVAAREACIVQVALAEAPTEGCEVVGGIATPEMIKTLYEHRLTGFAVR